MLGALLSVPLAAAAWTATDYVRRERGGDAQRAERTIESRAKGLSQS